MRSNLPDKRRKSIALIASITNPKGFATHLTSTQKLIARHYLGLGGGCPKIGKIVARMLYRISDGAAAMLVSQHASFVCGKARIWLNHGETWPERLKVRRLRKSQNHPHFLQALSVCEREDPTGVEAYRRVFGLNRTRQTTTEIAVALGYSSYNLVNHAIRRLSTRIDNLLRNPRTLESKKKFSEIGIKTSGQAAVRIQLMAVPDLEARFDLYRNQSHVRQLKYCYGLPPYRKPHTYSGTARRFGISEATLKISLFRLKEFILSDRCKDQLPPQINVTTFRPPSDDQLVIPEPLFWHLIDHIGHKRLTGKLIALALRLGPDPIRRALLVRRFTASSGCHQLTAKMIVEKLIDWGIFAPLNHGVYLRLTIDLNRPPKHQLQHHK